MNWYCTQIRAINPTTGELSFYAGPDVPGISFQDAEHYCQTHGLGYCKVIGRLVSVTNVHTRETFSIENVFLN